MSRTDIESRIVDANYAKEFTLDKKVYIEKATKQKIKVSFTDEEMNKLCKSIEFISFADMIVYACYSGWRPSELITLKIEDVDLKNEFIRGELRQQQVKIDWYRYIH